MSTASILASVIFGSIGLGALIYAKKQRDLKVLGIGLVLMVYPYFIENPFLLYGIGIALCAGLFFFHD